MALKDWGKKLVNVTEEIFFEFVNTAYRTIRAPIVLAISLVGLVLAFLHIPYAAYRKYKDADTSGPLKNFIPAWIGNRILGFRGESHSWREVAREHAKELGWATLLVLSALSGWALSTVFLAAPLIPAVSAGLGSVGVGLPYLGVLGHSVVSAIAATIGITWASSTLLAIQGNRLITPYKKGDDIATAADDIATAAANDATPLMVVENEKPDDAVAVSRNRTSAFYRMKATFNDDIESIMAGFTQHLPQKNRI